MEESSYSQSQIADALAEQIAFEFFNLKGKAKALPGEIDFNFKITTDKQSYILKISRPEVDLADLTCQDELLAHLESKAPHFKYPKAYRDDTGRGIFDYTDATGQNRKVRLLEWIEGQLYSSVQPKTDPS
jgi:Ser/Thr protein kinase RdoA (MazF antagonist)